MDISEPAAKRFRLTTYDAQDPSSILPFVWEDDDKESVHSWQSDETGKPYQVQHEFHILTFNHLLAWVADSADEWDNKTEDEEETVTEYELAEEDSEEGTQNSDCSSSTDFTVSFRALSCYSCS